LGMAGFTKKTLGGGKGGEERNMGYVEAMS
jgi:hypothetical protein